LSKAEQVLKAAFPIDESQKSSLRQRQLIPMFSIAPLPILVQCKTKVAAGAVCAIGSEVPKRNNQLLYKKAPAITLNGSHRLRGARNPLKIRAPFPLIKTFRMSKFRPDPSGWTIPLRHH
jgi:hypothetical protein